MCVGQGCLGPEAAVILKDEEPQIFFLQTIPAKSPPLVAKLPRLKLKPNENTTYLLKYTQMTMTAQKHFIITGATQT
jgi:hypothetical protein